MRWTNCCSYSKRISLWLCKKASLKVAAWSWGLCLLEEYHRRRHCQKRQLSAHFSWWHPLSCKPQGIQFPEGKRRLNPLEEGKHIWWTWKFGRKIRMTTKQLLVDYILQRIPCGYPEWPTQQSCSNWCKPESLSLRLEKQKDWARKESIQR